MVNEPRTCRFDTLLLASVTRIDAFLRPDGVIEHTCDGLCDPE